MAEVKITIKAKDEASKELEKIKKGLKNVAGEADDAGKKGKGLGVDWTMALIGINQGLEIARKAAEAFKKVIEFTKEGAALLRLEEASASLARSLNTDMDDIVRATREASDRKSVLQ